MNCDLAFELLTDAQGCRSEALEAHLAGCSRCRQMRDTLAPALAWFAESDCPSSLEAIAAPPGGSREPARVAGMSETVEVARRAAAVLAARTAPPSIRIRRAASGAVRYAAVLALGTLVGLAVARSSGPGPVAAASECTRERYAESSQTLTREEARLIVATCAACHLAQ
jgi:hypothetical protein